MTRQKSKFWTFMFSLIPGAGEMYMGFMKQGASIMLLFWGLIALSASLQLGVFMVLLPIIWFYSFFYVHNLKSMPEEDFYAMEDQFMFNLKGFNEDKISFIRKYRTILAAILIVMGASLLWNTAYQCLSWILPGYLLNVVYSIGNTIPRLFIAVLIIGLGIWLIRGKRKELSTDEDA